MAQEADRGENIVDEEESCDTSKQKRRRDERVGEFGFEELNATIDVIIRILELKMGS